MAPSVCGWLIGDTLAEHVRVLGSLHSGAPSCLCSAGDPWPMCSPGWASAGPLCGPKEGGVDVGGGGRGCERWHSAQLGEGGATGVLRSWVWAGRIRKNKLSHGHYI